MKTASNLPPFQGHADSTNLKPDLSPGSVALCSDANGSRNHEDYVLPRSLSNLVVHPVRTKKDSEAVQALRQRGYGGKYGLDELSLTDQLDSSPGCTLLVAKRLLGEPVGTLRLLDRRLGAIELDSFLQVDDLLNPNKHPVAEATRFCVPRCADSKWVKLALWKAFFLYCQNKGVKTMIISVRKNGARDYRHLLFENLGQAGAYTHPLLGSQAHETYAFDVASGPARYLASQHPLYHFFVTESHPQIAFE